MGRRTGSRDNAGGVEVDLKERQRRFEAAGLGRLTRLTRRRGGVAAPRPEACVFSPDGTKIAYVRRIQIVPEPVGAEPTGAGAGAGAAGAEVTSAAAAGVRAAETWGAGAGAAGAAEAGAGAAGAEAAVTGTGAVDTNAGTAEANVDVGGGERRRSADNKLAVTGGDEAGAYTRPHFSST